MSKTAETQKPTSKLFQSVTEDEYVRATQELFANRLLNPAYRDDELLLVMFIEAMRKNGGV